MAKYATVDDMIKRLGISEVIQLTDEDGLGEVNHDRAELALQDATDEIDGYLGRFALPFVEIPRVLKVYCCDIARYRLSGASVQETDLVVVRYEQAIAYLKQVASGKINLGGTAEGEQPASSGLIMFGDSKKVFGRDDR